MDRLLLTTCLTPVLILSAAPALAQTTIGGAGTTPLSTSSAGDVTVASGGSVTLGSGTAITVDSNNAATVASGGTLSMGAANGATGIVQNVGTTSTISNAGTISVLESYTPTVDSTGVVTEPVASASDRYGIHVLSGATSAGSITNSGTITVEGQNSAGILVESPYTGSIINTGTISVKGDNSVGIGTQAVSGNVLVNGTITTIGQGAQGVVINGDVGGNVTIQGTVTQARTYTADDGTTQALPFSTLAAGQAAVQINGNVANGVLLATTSSNSSTSGTSTSGSIISYGNAPSLLIGGASDISIGTVTGVAGTYSLVVDGSTSATAYYSNINATGIVIGGQGGAVNMAGGIGVSGSVTATTNNANATAILINSGATVPTLYNSGTISAVISETGGPGTAYGVRDLSGTLTTLNNTGFIKATGSSEASTTAIDLSANTTGVTITQSLNATTAAAQATAQAASGYDPLKATVYTSITGNILTGSGNDLLDIQSGAVYGNASLGGGNDTVKLSSNSLYQGNITFGAGTATMSMAGTSRFIGVLDVDNQVGTLTIADSAKFSGTVAGGSQLAVNVTGGTFGANATTTVAVNSLNVGAGGALGVYVDSNQATQFQATTATFASGSKISATLASLSGAEGNYTILKAGTLTGADSLNSTTASLPVLFNGALTVDGNNIDLDITRKTAAQLGLNQTQGQAYSAIYAAGVNTTALGNSLLQAADVPTLKSQFNQLMPDNAGGVFDVVTRGSRLAARHITDADSLFDISEVGGWIEPFYFHGNKHEDGATGYDTDGWGLSFGLEKRVSIGYIGVSVAYISGSVKNGDWQKVNTQDWELGAFWRKASGPLYTYARVAAGTVSMNSTRTFTGEVNDSALSYSAYGGWKGVEVTGAAGASYKFEFKNNLSLKPMLTVDYYRLHETGYTETGSDAIDLTVDGRTSDALTATPTVTLGWSMGEVTKDYRPLTFEVEGGPRAHLGGSLGTTTAAFVDGSQFSLTPDSLKSGWTAEARVLEGSFDHSWKIAAGADKVSGGGIGYSARASLNVAF
ncbi:MAG TPA: autotransporter outer membrane beta-barrel domain-containing protein [Sphingobium sp.]|uniref:autotransporter outer membrane beta-barrel domain-containing protein n=1 Tax=Sphingobium sp. TaxID=1912891 RepID=UPI002ED4E95C